MNFLQQQLAALAGSDKSTRLLLQRLIDAQQAVVNALTLEPDFPYNVDGFDRRFFGATASVAPPPPTP